MHTMFLKFHIWIPHENIVDLYFFSYHGYASFLSYAPFKTIAIESYKQDI